MVVGWMDDVEILVICLEKVVYEQILSTVPYFK